jgi:hypothetical protein
MATPISAPSTAATVAHGDRIGAEITGATLHILKGAGARGQKPQTLKAVRYAARKDHAAEACAPWIAMTENRRDYDGKAGSTLAWEQ